MRIVRDEDPDTVWVRAFDESDTSGWNAHRLSCAVAEVNTGPLFHKPGRVRISPLSFSDGTPEQLRAYAHQLLELADMADALQAEMLERYRKDYGQTDQPAPDVGDDERRDGR